MNEFDVVVVGGGPVGLWAACELRLAGLDVVVCERRQQRTEQSRALTIHGRTIEMFAMRGIADRFLAEGTPIPTGHYAALETRLDFSCFDTRFPFTLFLPQSRTEALIEDHARDLGVTILRGHVIESVTSEPTGPYRIEGRIVGGESVALSARAVVGADARRSVVRRAAEIAFDGSETSLAIMMGDVQVAGLDGRSVLMLSNERGGLTVAPVNRDGIVRVIVVDPARMKVPVDEPLTLVELAESASRVLGRKLELSEPRWLTRFGDECRLARSYRNGNLFLAGDAAHIHFPAGGQGMNVGIQDAMNLGWKLAAVLKGEAPAELLESYEQERRPVGAQLARNTQAQVALMTGFDAAHLALRAEMSDLLRTPAINRQLAGVLSGFDLSYPAIDLLGGVETMRVPDRTVKLSNGTEATIHGLLASGRWLHLSYVQGASVPLPDWLDRASVTFVEARSDVQGDVSALLVRPDGYSAGTSPQPTDN